MAVTAMAAEPETLPHPTEPPIPSAPPSAAENGEELTTPAHLSAENAAPHPIIATKRQRRPSVRLGEIGHQRAYTHAHESHARRVNIIPPWSWRTPKEASRTSKSRSLTNLANGGEENGNDRRGKVKRGSTTKRLRSNYTPRLTTEQDDGDETFGDFDHDQSPLHSDHNDNGYWHMGRHQDRARVSENDVVESDSRDGKKCEGVRSWLFELGLSRYAPMFEIHEVDDELLPMLTLEDLKDMGINAVGSRRKMYTAIQKLRKGIP